MAIASDTLITCHTPVADLDESALGGKGRNLFRLARAGFPVPPWMVISRRIFDRALAPHWSHIQDLLSEIDYTSGSSVDNVAERIGHTIECLSLCPDFCADLAEAVAEMGDGLYAVRSSALGEDGADHSFAGQMDSFLNVPAPGVLEAVKGVWASAFSARALTYRHRQQIPTNSTSTAVIVQQMVQSEAAGILFTRDPQSRAEECVIVAGWGLGEGAVADKVETDTYRITRADRVVARQVTRKTRRLVRGVNGHGGVRMEPVPGAMQERPVLTADQIRQLAELGTRAEEAFGAPQDMEWGFDESGDGYVLQTRPIVLAPQPDGSPVPRIWDNANIVESYPGLTLPLSFSFARHNYEVAFRNAALGFQLSGKAMGPDLSIFPNMIGLLDGRVYYNLRNWYVMLSYLPGFEQRKEAWDQMIGIAEDSPCPHADLTRLQRWGNLLTTTYRLLTVRRTNKRFFTHFRSTYTQYQNADLSVHTDEDLIALYESLCEDFLPQWHLTLYNDLFAMTFYRWLQKLCSRWGVSADPNLHNDLLVGEEGMESVAPVRSLARLAALVSRTPRYSQLFDTDDDEAVWSRLRDDARFGELADGIDEHLRLFGDRGPEELKLEKASLREEPARLIGLIRAYIQHGQTVEAMEQREWEVRQGARTRADQRLKGRLRRALFNFVLRQTRYGTTSRENMRFARTRLYGRARQLFGRMAELFVERGLIDARADFYYLTVQEAFGLVQGTAVTLDVRPLIQIRKAEYAAFAERVPRERMQITGIPSLGMTYETATGSSTQHRLVGTGCSSGRVQGNARVVTDPTEPLGEGDHILIAGSTDPGWVFLMTQARGIVVERGSVLSHTAIIGRELGIPTVVGAEGATTLIPEGARVSIDGSTGEIQWQ